MVWRRTASSRALHVATHLINTTADNSFDAQLKATQRFNNQLKARGLYQTGADAYVFSGANRWNAADTVPPPRHPFPTTPSPRHGLHSRTGRGHFPNRQRRRVVDARAHVRLRLDVRPRADFWAVYGR